MGDVCVVESAVIRQLQHAILQLCNEHVSYEHTLQVLGVVCVTVDDQPRDVVVKLNNTLKRVDAAVTPMPDDRRVGGVRAPASTLWPRAAGGGDASATCSSSSTAAAAGSSTLDRPGDAPTGRQGTTTWTEATPVAVVRSRKCHGRKQSNPVKLKTIVHDDNDDDDDDDDDDRGNCMSDCRAGGVLLIAPAEPSAAEDDPRVVTSPSSSPCILRPVGGPHLGVDEELPRRGRCHSETQTLDVGASPAVRALLPGMVAKTDVSQVLNADDDVLHRSCTSRTSSFVDAAPDDTQRDCASAGVQEAALNFSTRTPDAPANSGMSPDCIARCSTDKIKEEVLPPALPMSYGLDLGGRRSGTFDMSRSMTVAAAAAAFSQYVDDPAMLQSLTSYDQQRLALYTSLVTAAAASGMPPAGCDDTQAPPMSLLNGADVPSSKLDHSLAAMSGRLGDGPTMHRLPAIRRRERFGRGLHHSYQPTVKVKDIIMYDDSAPLHAQRGSRIEGDFMVDALHVEGRKRRRRSAEDTLSAEEIAEYMGTSSSSGSGQFACRYCGEVSADLSRYFAHTLTSHGSFVCHQCGKSFTTKSSLLRHRPIHTGMRRFACSICRKSFYRKDKCKAHIKRHLGLTDGPGPSSSPAALRGSSGPATPQLPPPVDRQLFASSVGPVNLAV